MQTPSPYPSLNAKTLLNVGSGPRGSAQVPLAFRNHDWREVRLDIDPKNEPDVLGTLLDMSVVASASIDALYTSHTIEHLYPNELNTAMAEFLRVLKPEGFAIITCPDLQAAAAMIAEDRLFDVAYQSPAGPVTPFDIVYSHRLLTHRDNSFMSHLCGFTLTTLFDVVEGGGFGSVAGLRDAPSFNLWVVASKQVLPDDAMRALAGWALG